MYNAAQIRYLYWCWSWLPFWSCLYTTRGINRCEDACEYSRILQLTYTATNWIPTYGQIIVFYWCDTYRPNLIEQNLFWRSLKARLQMVSLLQEVAERYIGSSLSFLELLRHQWGYVGILQNLNNDNARCYTLGSSLPDLVGD